MSEVASWVEDIYDDIGENDANEEVKDWLSTGVMSLNKAVSGRYDGGLPMGRIVEIFGGESSGKTLIATKAMAQTQAKGGLAVFLDYEHAFYMELAKKLGLSGERGKWIFKQPKTAEEGFEIIETIAEKVDADNIDMPITIVVDSIAAMVTEEEDSTEYGKENMRTNISLPRFLSSGVKKLVPLINNKNITLIFLNQTRDNLGVSFGEKKKTPGGTALKFYASVRIKLAKVKKEKDGDKIVGDNVIAECIKNKCAPPFEKADWVTSFETGINLELTHVRSLKAQGKLGNTKGFVEFAGKKYREKALVEELKNDPDLYAELLKLFEWE